MHAQRLFKILKHNESIKNIKFVTYLIVHNPGRNFVRTIQKQELSYRKQIARQLHKH